jgi:hypothetical protein
MDGRHYNGPSVRDLDDHLAVAQYIAGTLDVRVGCSRVRGLVVAEGDYCPLGVCSAPAGHEGTCAEASGWDEFDHSPWANDVISAELVACTLGARVRPELQMDYRVALRERLNRLLTNVVPKRKQLART